MKVVVGLKGLVKHSADQCDHPLIISPFAGLREGHVILVYQDNGFLTIIFSK